MIFREAHKPLTYEEVPKPRPSAHQILIKVSACGVCRTDVHIFEGDLKEPKVPLILGHQIVGRVTEIGRDVTEWRVGDRACVPWLGSSCQHCYFCTHNSENLCDHPGFTGYTLNGGYAEYAVADSRYCFALPDHYDDLHAAPLLCAGLIGYRSLKKTGDAEHIGFYGFGAAAALLIQVAQILGKKIYAFTKEGDLQGQKLALEMGAVWAGSSLATPPYPLDAAIIFAPVGDLVPLALKAVRKGGCVILGGIHMTPIPAMNYDLIWGERTITSVANLTRQDGQEFFALLSQHQIHPIITTYPLKEANKALEELRTGKVKGSLVLNIAASS
jgi:propanol-preferring alcohol dehydrogenase